MRKGIYLRGITEKHPSPEKSAALAKKYGIDFVAIMALWQEGDMTKRINSTKIAEYSSAFEEAGVEPWLWGYPWCGREQEFIDRVQWCQEKTDGRLCGYIIDPERGYQGHVVGHTEAKQGAQRLISGLIDVMDEGTDLGVTSFGCANIHRSFPWEQFCAGFASPQFYTAPYADMIRGLKRWNTAGWQSFIPSIPAYGPNSESKLSDYWGLIKGAAKVTKTQIDGFIVWSWQQLSSKEWQIITDLD